MEVLSNDTTRICWECSQEHLILILEGTKDPEKSKCSQNRESEEDGLERYVCFNEGLKSGRLQIHSRYPSAKLPRCSKARWQADLPERKML